MRVVTQWLAVIAVALCAGTAHSGLGDCSQPVSAGTTPTASDCLFILKAAVGTAQCTPECICAPTGSLPITATDALACLRNAVGQPVALDCPCPLGSTTTTTLVCNTPDGGAITQEAYVKASNTEEIDVFGSAVAVSCDTLVVGAYAEDSASTGVNGDQQDNTRFNSGAAYVYTRNGATWAQQAYLKASNPNNLDVFGSVVAASGDTVVVGARGESSSATGIDGDESSNSAGGSGAAYVFVRNGSTWSQQAYLKASNTDGSDKFGNSIAIDGDTIVVGASDEDSSASGINGDQNDDTAAGAGAVYVFVRSGNTWMQQAYLKASNTDAGDQFGRSVSIDGNTIVVGAGLESSAASGVGGNQGDNSLQSSGAAYVFVRNGNAWTQQAYLKASNPDERDGFGSAVSISGNTVVVGARGERSRATGVNGDQSDNGAFSVGAAYVFVRNAATWTQQAYLKASNAAQDDSFAGTVAASGNRILVGAVGEDSAATGVNGNESDNSLDLAGAAYLFVRSGNTWMQEAYIKASNTGAQDQFATSIALSGDTIAIGAVAEQSAATGINGDQGDSIPSAGAAYVLR